MPNPATAPTTSNVEIIVFQNIKWIEEVTVATPYIVFYLLINTQYVSIHIKVSYYSPIKIIYINQIQFYFYREFIHWWKLDYSSLIAE